MMLWPVERRGTGRSATSRKIEAGPFPAYESDNCARRRGPVLQDMGDTRPRALVTVKKRGTTRHRKFTSSSRTDWPDPPTTWGLSTCVELRRPASARGRNVMAHHCAANLPVCEREVDRCPVNPRYSQLPR